MIELQAIITGKVQGVGFRDYIATEALARGLLGFVQNQADGSVYVLAQGLPDLLKELVECLHEGSVLAEVKEVDTKWQTAGKTYSDFSVLH